MKADIIIPTLNKPHLARALESLRYVPFPFTLHLIDKGSSWPEAINIGLSESKGDIILMDDDVELLPDTFKDFDPETADIIGFKLLFPNSTIQHAGVSVKPEGIRQIGWKRPSSEFDYPQRVCAVTASLMYIHREVIDEIAPMSVWDGYQFEDTDFCFRALKAGFTIVTTPATAIHHESLTKKQFPDFEQKMKSNLEKLASLYFQDEFFVLKITSYPRPIKEHYVAAQ